LRTLDCAARCLQARTVGGDYFDFLDLGPGLTGLVLAGVSGEGVHAALLVANLHAHLSGQSSTVPFDPVAALQRVNRRICQSTSGRHFATLFVGVYDDTLRRLTYANCGHNPPMLLRGDGSLERLDPTATVIGMFESLECAAMSVTLRTGDLLAVFSDGVTEARRDEEEYGEARLLAELRAGAALSAEEAVGRILRSVEAFGRGTQSDDLTLLVARVVA
jgi:serine phosphatase RsbU (regulator of sigma subunit)